MKRLSKTGTAQFLSAASFGVLSLFVAGSIAQADILPKAPVTGGAIIAVADTAAEPAANKAPVQQSAEKFIASLGQRGIDFLGNQQQTPAQKEESFRRLLEDSFDIDAIGKFALGVYWRQATPEQRTEYLKLFKRSVVEMYSQRFSEYNGQKLSVTGSRPAGNEANDIVVLSKVVSPDGSEPVPVEWVVQSKNGKHKVLDVFILGTSQSMNQRNQFKQIIQQGGGDVQVLINNLKART